MRILGYSEKWDKLNQDESTTFRFERRDKDWQVNERVQMVFKPRRKGGGERLGIADIIAKESRAITGAVVRAGIPLVTNEEAVADGFENKTAMQKFMFARHGMRIYNEPMNKLTVVKVK